MPRSQDEQADVLRKRRLLEMAYLHAWGRDGSPGSPDLRDEWRALYLAWLPATGTMTYHGAESMACHGADRFTWEGP